MSQKGEASRFQSVKKNIFRIQASEIDRFPITPMEKYGIVRYSWEGSRENRYQSKIFPAKQTKAYSLNISYKIQMPFTF